MSTHVRDAASNDEAGWRRCTHGCTPCGRSSNAATNDQKLCSHGKVGIVRPVRSICRTPPTPPPTPPPPSPSAQLPPLPPLLPLLPLLPPLLPPPLLPPLSPRRSSCGIIWARVEGTRRRTPRAVRMLRDSFNFTTRCKRKEESDNLLLALYVKVVDR